MLVSEKNIDLSNDSTVLLKQTLIIRKVKRINILPHFFKWYVTCDAFFLLIFLINYPLKHSSFIQRVLLLSLSRLNVLMKLFSILHVQLSMETMVVSCHKESFYWFANSEMK